MNKVDVIVVSWNGRQHLMTCLPALKKQTFKEFRVILVDNGSNDDTAEWVRANHSWVKLITLKKNVGFTGANIAGYKQSNADYIVLLNNDTRPEADWLNILVDAADKHSDVGIVASTMLRWDTDVVDTAGDACTMAGTGYKASTGLRITQLKDGYVFGACAGAALYKRCMINQIGFLDPDYFLNQEDIDISFRAQLTGWKVWLASRAIVHHRVTATNGKLSPVVVYNGAKNNEATYWKNMPTKLLIKTLPHRIVQTFLSFIKIGILQGMAWPFLKGKLYSLLHIRSILKKRKKNMQLINVHPDYIYKILTPVFSFEYFFLRKRIRSEYNESQKNHVVNQFTASTK